MGLSIIFGLFCWESEGSGKRGAGGVFEPMLLLVLGAVLFEKAEDFLMALVADAEDRPWIFADLAVW